MPITLAIMEGRHAVDPQGGDRGFKERMEKRKGGPLG